jgi:hypothetical protein
VERVAWIALVEDDLISPESAPRHGCGQDAESGGLDMCEQGALLEAVYREFRVAHVVYQLPHTVE